MKHVIVKTAMSLILIPLMWGCAKDDIMDPDPEQDPEAESVKISIFRDMDRTLDWNHATNKIAFRLLGSDDYYDVALMDPDGSNVVCLTCDHPDLPNRHISNPTFDPSGKWIVMQVEKQEHFGSSTFSTPGVGYNSDLFALRIEDKSVYRLTDLPTKKRIGDKTPVTGVLHAHLSHSGKSLVWGQMEDINNNIPNWKIQLANISFDSGEDVKLTNIQTFEPGFNKQWYETHGFSPDDSKIIFTGNLEKDQKYEFMDIYTMDVKTGESSLKNLTNTPLDRWDEHAHFSPDGKRIVWIRSVNDFDPDDWRGTMKTEYFMMDANGENKKQVTFFNTPEHSHYKIFEGKRVIVADSAWSPDGLSIMASIAVDSKPYIVLIEGL